MGDISVADACLHFVWSDERRKLTVVKIAKKHLYVGSRSFEVIEFVTNRQDIMRLANSVPYFARFRSYTPTCRLWDKPMSHLTSSLGRTACKYVDDPLISSKTRVSWLYTCQ